MDGPVPKTEMHWNCGWLQEGLAFSPSVINACCVQHHERLGWPILVEHFEGGALPIDQIAASRQRIIEENQLPDRHGRCKGCPILVEAEHRPVQFPVGKINFSHFSKCNLKCSYCYTRMPDFIPVDRPLDLVPTVKDMITQRYLRTDADISWGGGEVTILQGFDKMFGMLMEYGTNHLIASNAVIFSHIIKDALTTRRVHLVVSIDAGKRATYRRIKRVDAFDRVWRNLAEYARVGGDMVWAKCILTKHTVWEVAEFFERAVGAGVQVICVDLDAFQSHLHDQAVSAAAWMANECNKKGIKFVAGFSGVNAFPENRFRERVAEALDSGKFSLPIQEPLQKVIRGVSHSFEAAWVDFRMDLNKTPARRFVTRLSKRPVYELRSQVKRLINGLRHNP